MALNFGQVEDRQLV